MMKKLGFRKANILLTGSSGFIGQNLLPKLKDHKVTLYDKKEGHDIFDPILEEYVKKNDVVIHLAAQVSVNKSFLNPAETHRVNVLGTARVVELCLKYKKKLIYPSSAAVAHPELSPYAQSKWLAEEIVKGVRGAIPVVILRLYNVFGPGMNADSGSIMYNFLTSKKITVFGDGEQTRDFIHINDVTNIMVDAIKKKWDGKLVDVGTGEAYSTNYVAGLFQYFRGLDKIYYEAPRREIKWSIANTETLDSLYRENLTTHLEKNIKELCEK